MERRTERRGQSCPPHVQSMSNTKDTLVHICILFQQEVGEGRGGSFLPHGRDGPNSFLSS